MGDGPNVDVARSSLFLLFYCFAHRAARRRRLGRSAMRHRGGGWGAFGSDDGWWAPAKLI